MIAVVSSCSAAGWNAYGRQFVDTFEQYWPTDIRLHLVSEDPMPLSTARVSYRALGESNLAVDFLTRHRENPIAHGREKPRLGFRYDAYKFSKKVFAIELIARILTGKLLWIDADVITFEPVPVAMLDHVLPDDYALSCLARNAYHSECGFVGYNLDHPATRDFINAFAWLYASDAVLDLNEWHDSWVFDWLRKQREVPTHAIPHRSQSHPFINSELGHYMDHLKGTNRKKAGRSAPQELLKLQLVALLETY